MMVGMAGSAAAILDDGTVDVDALLAAVVARETQFGRRVRGLLMTYPEGREGCQRPMVMVDVATGESYTVSQDLGRGASGCRADLQGFARAGQVLHAALDDAELVVCNRFGSLEAEGKGFAAELLAILAAGIPLLTAVSTSRRERWFEFSGGATVLPAAAQAVDAWLATLLPQPADQRS